VANLRYDALFDTQDFLHAVDHLDEYGADVAQFSKLPRTDIGFDDPRPNVRATRYRAFGLRVRIDLPHRNEVANIITLDQASMQEALTRLGATWTPQRHARIAQRCRTTRQRNRRRPSATPCVPGEQRSPPVLPMASSRVSRTSSVSSLPMTAGSSKLPDFR
jgi:hypothetical protein